MSYMDNVVKIDGKDIGDVFLFTLSTCAWCKKTKKLFKDLGVKHSYVDVDLLVGKDKIDAENEIYKRMKKVSFPLIILNDEDYIFGYDEEKIKEYCNDK